jgi:hypothetical protein
MSFGLCRKHAHHEAALLLHFNRSRLRAATAAARHLVIVVNTPRHFSSPDGLDPVIRIAAPVSASRRCLKASAAAQSQAARQRHRGALADRALHVHLAIVQSDQALHDRQAEAGAFVLALIGLAGLEERIADPREILGGDPDPGIGDDSISRDPSTRRKPSRCRRAR